MSNSLLLRRMAALATLSLCSLAPSLAQSNPDIPPAEFIQHIDAAVNARFTGVDGYTVQEHYAIFRNGGKDSVADMTVHTVYTRAVGKQYTPISQSGNEIFRHAIIEKILTNERDMTTAANREGTWLTSANYEMQVNPAKVSFNGHQCYIVALKARRKSTYLFNGRAWFDSADATLVRLEGTPSESPSFLAGETTIARDYSRLEGFAMATHAEAHSHSFLVGDTILKIDYVDYHLDLAPPPSAAIAEKH